VAQCVDPEFKPQYHQKKKKKPKQNKKKRRGRRRKREKKTDVKELRQLVVWLYYSGSAYLHPSSWEVQALLGGGTMSLRTP
jgi:hypothetical protein